MKTSAVGTLACILLCVAAVDDAHAQMDGEMRLYHPLTLTLAGPTTSETASPNPFRDYRLTVTFRHETSGDVVVAPGYFAADGYAADTGASSGNRWRAHLTPHQTGRWTYEASMRRGPDVAMSLDAFAGEVVPMDGAAGDFDVMPTNKSGRDFRGRGVLRYAGEHYLRFDDGTWFLKGGADSPETLLAYFDFDQTSVHAGSVSLKRYADHEQDWHPGDPTWRGGRGRGLIGALNYLASEEMNAVSFLTMNVAGDGKNVWPWTSHDVYDRFDVSKMAQWERVFSHADSIGLFLHFKTQETENDRLLDGGELGPHRKLYYRELVARFGHHLALNWNLGEENDIWEELDDRAQLRVRSYAEYVQALDPYDHPIVIHSYPDQQVEVYVPLLGPETSMSGVSLQTHWNDVHDHTLLWRRASAAAGKAWVIANDEQGGANDGVLPDGPESNQDAIRHETIWGHLMAGGAGLEFYFGYEHAHNDLNLEDYRSRDRFWDYVRHALHFFQAYLPFWEMNPNDGLLDGPGYALAAVGRVYAAYLPSAREAVLNLDKGRYTVHWYSPRAGGPLIDGDPTRVEGSGRTAVGRPPEADGDWVVLVRRTD